MSKHNPENHSSRSSDDWHISRKQTDQPRTFSIKGLYSPSDFLNIVRAAIDYANQQGDMGSGYVKALENWESRALHLVDSTDNQGQGIQIGFRQCDDGIVRIYFTNENPVFRE